MCDGDIGVTEDLGRFRDEVDGGECESRTSGVENWICRFENVGSVGRDWRDGNGSIGGRAVECGDDDP